MTDEVRGLRKSRGQSAIHEFGKNDFFTYLFVYVCDKLVFRYSYLVSGVDYFQSAQPHKLIFFVIVVIVAVNYFNSSQQHCIAAAPKQNQFCWFGQLCCPSIDQGPLKQMDGIAPQCSFCQWTLGRIT